MRERERERKGQTILLIELNISKHEFEDIKNHLESEIQKLRKEMVFKTQGEKRKESIIELKIQQNKFTSEINKKLEVDQENIH